MLYALTVLLANEGGAEKSGDGPSPLMTFVPLIAMFALFYFLVILPAQRREKKQREMVLGALKKNDEVVTSAGIIGVVSSIKENADEVTLRLEDNARVRVLKSSIVRIVPKDGGAEAAK